MDASAVDVTREDAENWPRTGSEGSPLLVEKNAEFHQYFVRRMSISPSDIQVLIVDREPKTVRLVTQQLRSASYQGIVI